MYIRGLLSCGKMLGYICGAEHGLTHAKHAFYHWVTSPAGAINVCLKFIPKLCYKFKYINFKQKIKPSTYTAISLMM